MRGYAITPRKSESNAPGPDYKLISVPEDWVTTTEAKAKLNALLADVERTGCIGDDHESWASGSCVDAGASG